MTPRWLRELLIDNTGFATNLIATNASARESGTVIQQSWAHNWPVFFVGSNDNGRWICFSNVNFGAGVSNLSVILATDSASTNRKLEVRVGSTNGPRYGTLDIVDTGGWADLSEQSTVLTNTLSGTQTVFFVSVSPGSALANLYRFRFHRDPNSRTLFNTFRTNYFTTQDIDHLKALGYNCLRVPFLYNQIQDYTGTNYPEEGWAYLDWVVNECRKRQLWCILDLHGTPGGQNWSDHGGFADGLRNRMWNSAAYRNRTTNLWQTVAARYAGNCAVAGYDLFNEPDPWRPTNTLSAYQLAYSNSILPMLSQCYSAIRSKDTNHLVFMESNFMYTDMWNDLWTCPAPASRGWTNVVYEFHHYDRIVYGQTKTNDDAFATQKAIADSIVRTYTRLSQERQVPVFVGEFCPVKMQNFDYFIRQFEASGLHWANWNFRHWGYDDTNHPWSSWGLDYRVGGVYNGGVNTAIQPNVKTDSFAALTNKLAQYKRANYIAHPFLPDVVENTAGETNTANERTEFYLNTFDGPNSQGLTTNNAWPWRKIVGGGNAGKFWIQSGRARFMSDSTPLLLRVASRSEADARFVVDDQTGCNFSFEFKSCEPSNILNGATSEVRLVVTRDSITNRIYSEASPALIARLTYAQSPVSTNVNLQLYAKDATAGTYGTLLASNTVPFSADATFQVFENSATASISYAGTVISTNHGLGVTNWVGGAVCVVEVESIAGAAYVDLDNLRGWRPNAGFSSGYTNSMTDYPSGIYALAEPERLAIRTWAPTNDWANSYMTNGTLYCIPEQTNNGWQCVNPRRDYQNDVRLNLTSTNVVEIRAAYTNFTQGIARICVLPEYFPGEIKSEYEGLALYVEASRQGTNIVLEAYRHMASGEGGLYRVGSPASVGYEPGQTITMEIGATNLQVYYGTACPIDAPHALTNITAVFANGAYPHYEFNNTSNTTTAVVQMNKLRVRASPHFTVPAE